MYVLSILAGMGLIGVVLLDAFETVVLPRRASGKFRLTRLFYVSTWRPWRMVASRMRNVRTRETAFSFFGPLSLLLLMAAWAFGLVWGFGLLFYGSGAHYKDPLGYGSLRSSIYLSGTTLFTLGLGDIVPPTRWVRDLSVIEAGTGLGFVAIVIGYLPVLYAAFSRREVTIALLDGRAGSPPTSAELLRRHAIECETEALAVLLADWERWSAELLESHISFPLLCYFRSQHDNQSWLSALTAVLDTTALLLSIVSTRSIRQAQLTFAMARHAVVDLMQVFGLEGARPDQAGDTAGLPDRLDQARLDELKAFLASAGLRVSEDPRQTALFGELRAMYEGQVLVLSRYLYMPVPPFLSTTEKRDTWMKVHRLRQRKLVAGEVAPDGHILHSSLRGEAVLAEDPHPF